MVVKKGYVSLMNTCSQRDRELTKLMNQDHKVRITEIKLSQRYCMLLNHNVFLNPLELFYDTKKILVIPYLTEYGTGTLPDNFWFFLSLNQFQHTVEAILCHFHLKGNQILFNTLPRQRWNLSHLVYISDAREQLRNFWKQKSIVRYLSIHPADPDPTNIMVNKIWAKKSLSKFNVFFVSTCTARSIKERRGK